MEFSVDFYGTPLVSASVFYKDFVDARLLMLIPEDFMRLQLIYFLTTVKPVYSRNPWFLKKCPLQPGCCYIEFWIFGAKEDNRN